MVVMVVDVGVFGLFVVACLLEWGLSDRYIDR